MCFETTATDRCFTDSLTTADVRRLTEISNRGKEHEVFVCQITFWHCGLHPAMCGMENSECLEEIGRGCETATETHHVFGARIAYWYYNYTPTAPETPSRVQLSIAVSEWDNTKCGS